MRHVCMFWHREGLVSIESFNLYESNVSIPSFLIQYLYWLSALMLRCENIKTMLQEWTFNFRYSLLPRLSMKQFALDTRQ